MKLEVPLQIGVQAGLGVLDGMAETEEQPRVRPKLANELTSSPSKSTEGVSRSTFISARCAIHSSRSSERAVSHQKGAPAPIRTDKASAI